MRIAIFTDTYSPQINGVVTSTMNLAIGLADKGHRIYIVAPKFNKTREIKHKNIKVKRISGINTGVYEDFKLTNFDLRLFNYIKKEKIEVIHFQTPISLGMQAILIAKVLKLPLVGTYHTAISDPQYLKYLKMNNELAKRLSWVYTRMFYNKCDLVTCPSESMRKELKDNGIKKEIGVISNGINLNMFDNSKSWKVKSELNKKGDLILFVGRIANEKNILYLIDCFSIVAKRLPGVKLVIVGDGPQMGEVKEKINALRLNDNISLLGRIDHKDLVKSSLFGACKVFATASLTETQGITLLEAQANGVVGVGVDAKGTKDLIIDGYNGYLVKRGRKKEFAEKIIKTLTDKKQYKIMRENTLKEVKKHDLCQVISTWEKTYSDLIEKNK